MTDLMQATQDGILGAMKAGMSPTSGVVTQHVLAGTLPPFNFVGDIELERQAEDLFLARVEVISVYRGEGRAPLLAQMNDAQTAILEGTVAADGAIFGDLKLVASAASTPGQDGVSYAGISTFEIYVEPA